MALLTNLTVVSARLADLTRSSGAHVAAAANLCNEMVTTLLSLSNEEATAWLNAQNPADINQLFTDHLVVGTNLNATLEALKSQLQAASIPFDPRPVDVRPVTDKLAEQGRQMSIGATGFLVENIPAPVVPEEPPYLPPGGPEGEPYTPPGYEGPPADVVDSTL